MGSLYLAKHRRSWTTRLTRLNLIRVPAAVNLLTVRLQQCSFDIESLSLRSKRTPKRMHRLRADSVFLPPHRPMLQ